MKGMVEGKERKGRVIEKEETIKTKWKARVGGKEGKGLRKGIGEKRNKIKENEGKG